MNDFSKSMSALEARLWFTEPASPSRRVRLFRMIATIVRGAIGDRIWMRAGNMTYMALLYIVPVGALALSHSSRLGWKGLLSQWIEQRLSPTAPELAASIVAAMDRLNIVAISFVGLGAIIIAGAIALNELEADFRQILHASTSRKWWQRALMYPVTIVVAPTIVAIVLALGAIAKARTTIWIGNLEHWGTIGRWVYHRLVDLPFVFELLPYLLTWMLLTLLYYLVTSAPIRFRSAVVGGLAAAIVWQIAQGLYINFQFGSATYKEIWGYLAQIPMLLILIYASWVILFLGAEAVFAWQYRHAFLPKWPISSRLPPNLEKQAAVETACEVLRSYAAKPEGITAESMSMNLKVPWQLIGQVAHALAGAGFLAEHRTSQGFAYTPRAGLASLTAAQLIEKYESRGADSPLPRGFPDRDPDATLAQLAGLGE